MSSSESEEELPFTDEEELEEEAAGYEEERYGPRWRAVEGKPKVSGPTKGPVLAFAPPPYAEGEGKYSFCTPKILRALRQMFPVFEDDGVQSHQPLGHKQVKELAESVHTYGVTANFTMSQIERLSETAMTPTDWQCVTKPCLASMGQYVEWKALWHDYSQVQACANAAAGQPVLDPVAAASQFHSLFHVTMETLCKRFSISRVEARNIVLSCGTMLALQPTLIGDR